MANTLLRAEGPFKHWKTDAIDMSGTNSSDPIRVFRFTSGSWSLVWSSVVGSGDVCVEVSHDDGVNWDVIEGSLITTVGASGSDGGQTLGVPGGLLRITVMSAATSGFVTLYFIGKEEN